MGEVKVGPAEFPCFYVQLSSKSWHLQFQLQIEDWSFAILFHDPNLRD